MSSTPCLLEKFACNCVSQHAGRGEGCVPWRMAIVYKDAVVEVFTEHSNELHNG